MLRTRRGALLCAAGDLGRGPTVNAREYNPRARALAKQEPACRVLETRLHELG